VDQLPTVRRYLDLVADVADDRPDHVAVVGPDGRLTFAEVDDRVARFGSALRGLGLEPGARVALLAANELEYLELQATCLRSGYALVPLNTRLATAELRYILGDCSPDVLIAGREEHERVASLVTELGIPHGVGLGPSSSSSLTAYDDLLADATPAPDQDPQDPELVATILYTSGTTGRPKGAVIDRVGFTTRVLVDALELGADEHGVFQITLPMFHIAAFLAYAYVARGGTLVLLPTFDAESCLASMSEHRVTSTVLVPTLIAALLDDPAIARFDPSRLELIVYGGASIDPPLLERALVTFGCGFHQQYGMTETGVQTVLHPADHDPDDRERLTSAGRPVTSTRVRIVDPDDRPVARGQVGEICCTGPSLMTGYWNLPEVTAETLRGGWLHTGDLGYIDPAGRLHIVDRRNDLIITGGENVYPREVEAVLADLPAVTEVSVIGLPDARWGEVVTGVLPTDGPSDEEVDAFLRERLAGYKVPKRWYRVDELPRTATGKVIKSKLRQTLLEDGS
jgi:acyl-CoA synthetase (AMP-forming)/AMP-acid ligase II